MGHGAGRRAGHLPTPATRPRAARRELRLPAIAIAADLEHRSVGTARPPRCCLCTAFGRASWRLRWSSAACVSARAPEAVSGPAHRAPCLAQRRASVLRQHGNDLRDARRQHDRRCSARLWRRPSHPSRKAAGALPRHDISPKMLRRAGRRREEAATRSGRARAGRRGVRSPWTAEAWICSSPTSVCTACLTPAAPVREAARCLRRGGWLVQASRCSGAAGSSRPAGP